MPNARAQHIHGTYSNFEANKTAVLNDEIAIVDSGHPDTKEGAAAYYRPAGASEPVRLANASELLHIYKINKTTVPESEDWYDRQGNPAIPITFEGFTGKAPELIFWEEATSIWLLYNIAPDPTTGKVNYFWSEMLTRDAV